ncbi:MAG: hypothetical protein ACK41P_00960 [Asticcacaulis sp.]
MFGIPQQLADQLMLRLREAQGTIVTLALAVILIGIGSIWLSVGLVLSLGEFIGDGPAALAVGTVLICGTALFVWIQSRQKQAKDSQLKAQAEAEASARSANATGPEAFLSALMGKPIEGMIQASPLMAIGIALLIGVFAVRFPGPLMLLIEMLKKEWNDSPS